MKAVENRHKFAEEKLEAANVVELRNEDGLPLTEITEELDDDDNVVSSTVSKPGSAAPQLIEALRQSGVTDVPGEKTSSNDDVESGHGPVASQSSNKESSNRDKITISIKTQKDNIPSQKKSVSFADTSDSISEGAGSQETSSSDFHIREVHEKLRESSSHATTPGQPVIPDNESLEEATLRREMLEYNLNEVGAIVAEMDLDDEDVEEDEEDYSSESDGSHDGTDEDDEDEFGRTTKRTIDNDYKAQMLELERKLNAKALRNAGPSPTMVDARSLEAKVFKPRKGGTKAESTGDTSTTTKKGVRFAESLDIQKAPSKPTNNGIVTTEITQKDPIAAAIVERNPSESTHSKKASTQAKPSRFKATRASTSSASSAKPHNAQSNGAIANGPLAGLDSTAHFFPASQASSHTIASSPKPQDNTANLQSDAPKIPHGRTHAEVLVERPVDETEQDVKEPDEFDPALMHQGIAVEYHRMRNRMIQRNGGFAALDDDEELESVSQNAEAGGRKMSRFKAAKLGKSGR